MHPASAFHETDARRLTDFIRSRGFALIVGCEDGRPILAHAPVRLDGERLGFHLSAANRLCAPLIAQGRAIAVLTGPDAYISPDWYGMADQVPTWNYLAAEAEGPVRKLDRDETITLLDDLSAHFEAALAPKLAWTRQKVSPARFEALLNGIVGFEMRVERLEGTTKLAQNKPREAMIRVAERLAVRTDPGAQAIATLMSAAIAADS